MSDARDEWIPFGTLGRAHGLRGEIRLVPHQGEDALPDGVKDIGLGTDDHVRPVKLAGVRPTSGALLLRLEGMHSRDAVQALTGTAVLLRRKHLPALEDGEFYLFELEAAAVQDEQGIALGRVKSVQSNPAQDLLVIETPEGERMLPLIPETVMSFDRTAKVLVVAVVEGLWELEAADVHGTTGEQR